MQFCRTSRTCKVGRDTQSIKLCNKAHTQAIVACFIFGWFVILILFGKTQEEHLQIMK
jgi:hypothetical protein